jgi:hypothetical protein
MRSQAFRVIHTSSVAFRVALSFGRVAVFLSVIRPFLILEGRMRYSADVKGGLFGQYGSPIGSIGPHLTDHHTRKIAQMLSNKGEFALRSVLDTLLGSAPGQLASYWTAEIQASPELGGVRPIVQTYVVNRTTTAADVTDIRNMFTLAKNSTPTQAQNLDMNPLGTR